MDIKTSNLFPKCFNQDFREILNHTYTEYVEAGGRGSCKSSAVSIWLVILIIQNPTFNALVLRKVSNTLRDSVYSQLKWATEKLGVSHLFNFTLTPLQATYLPTGQTIFFRGADDPLKIKSIKASKGYIAITWFEETAEFTLNDVETIKLSSMRGGDVFYNFFSYNPPSSVRNWVNTEFRKPRQDRLFHESTYLDVPAEWLGDAFLNEAELMKKNNLRGYENIFLGKATGTGTNVFENVEIRQITQEEIEKFEWNYAGVDFGYFPDAFRFIVFCYDMKTRTMYIYRELHLLKHSNYEACQKMRQFMIDKGIDLNMRITGDSANPKDVADFRQYGFNFRGAIKGKGSLDSGFKWLQSIHIVVDPIECPYTTDELSNYEYEIDKRTGEILSGYPQNQPDHSLASLRYGSEEIWRVKGN